jgi:hypothetical protein
MDLNNTSNRTVLAVVVVVLIVGAWFLGRASLSGEMSPSMSASGTTTGRTTSPATNSNQAMTETTGNVTAPVSSQESVSVSDQTAGMQVTVRSVSLPQTGWVAVRDSSGSVLGAGLFNAGTNSGTVPLLRGTTAGERYQVLLYIDDGDKQFDLHKDTLLMNSDGSVAGTTFTAN